MKNIKTCVLVIFGASGDLTIRKLIPALYRLYQQRIIISNKIKIVGVARSGYASIAEFSKLVSSCIVNKEDDQETLQAFLELFDYVQIKDYENCSYWPLKYKIDHYVNALTGVDKKNSNILFYLATPPNLYYRIPEKLASLGYDKHDDNVKIIIEKPFGYNEISAHALNQQLLENFYEEQILRIDHYLGKETVQNLLVLRFANSIFEPLWNSQYIENIQIFANESLGVGNRAGYYDQSGALKDMIQNHLLQLLAMTAMEPPAKIDASCIRTEISKALQSVRRFKNEKIYPR